MDPADLNPATSNIGSDVLDVVLEHHGVKGQKWGVRKDRSPVPASVSQPKPGGKLKTQGGKNLPASDDAIKAAVLRQTAQGSRVHALSNDQLKTLTQRMQLEQTYANLQRQRTPEGTLARGHKFVKTALGFGKTANEVDAFAKSPMGQQLKTSLAKKAVKRTVKVAATAAVA